MANPLADGVLSDGVVRKNECDPKSYETGITVTDLTAPHTQRGYSRAANDPGWRRWFNGQASHPARHVGNRMVHRKRDRSTARASNCRR